MGRKLECRRLYQSQSGMSLLEVTIALAILLIVSIGILSMGTLAVATTENQGHLEARATEYAQDKIEQLNSLAFGDTQTDTTAFPPASTGGSGLTVGGSSDPNNPVTTPGTGYVDYLDISGQPTASTGNWFYVRVWQISNPAGGVSTCTVNGVANSACLKQITVTAKVRREVGAPAGALPQATLTTMKTYPF
jgi:type II secretory pathway pseudopilin PulG